MTRPSLALVLCIASTWLGCPPAQAGVEQLGGGRWRASQGYPGGGDVSLEIHIDGDLLVRVTQTLALKDASVRVSVTAGQAVDVFSVRGPGLSIKRCQYTHASDAFVCEGWAYDAGGLRVEQPSVTLPRVAATAPAP